MGHVQDLPSKKLGFDPENHFMPQYEIPKDKKKTITELKKAISKDTSIYLATDEDREGESISWHLISALGLEKKPIQRIVFHEVTPGAIQQPWNIQGNWTSILWMPSKPEGFLIGRLDTNFPHFSGERSNQGFPQVGSKVLPSGSWLTENGKSGNSNRKNTGKYGPILKAFMQN